MTRRFSLLALSIVLVVLGAAPAVAGGKGELTSAFRNEVNQFNPDFDLTIDRPEGFIPVFSPAPVEVCDDQIVGTWFSLTGETKNFFDGFFFEYRLDGEVLNDKTTPPRRRTLEGERVWAVTAGVPVIGTLDAGTHVLEADFGAFGLFTVDIDSSSAHC